MILYQKFVTTPDANGASRRGWLISETGFAIVAGAEVSRVWRRAWVTEGLRGMAALDAMLCSLRVTRKTAGDLGTVNVAPREFRANEKSGPIRSL